MPVCLECIRKAPIRRCAFVWNTDFLIFFTGADVRACVRVCLTFDECLRYTRSHPHPRAGDYSYVTLQLYLHDVPVENGGATTFYPNTGEDFYRSPSRYANRPFRIAVMAIIISIFTTYHHHMPSIIVSHLLLYCFIRPFFFFFLGRGGLFALLIDVHVDEWHFILPNLGTAQYHANLKQEVSWSLRKTCRTKDRCSKQESSTQCALKQCTCESSVMENKLIYLLLLLPLAADERPNVTFFFRYSPVDYGRASDYWAAILWYFRYHTHTFSHTIFLFNRIALKK